jgi:hypothetical protein
MSSLSSIQLQNAREFLKSLGGQKYSALANLMAEGFTHRFFPVTLNGLGMPVRNATELLDHIKEVYQVIEEFNVSYKFVCPFISEDT